jgi:predicted glycoside hydrolase/deacetylase ChbG (UPF0249 family)
MTLSLVERLGFQPGTRVAVIHTDDIGMCHAANQGAFQALTRGVATCGSMMVPCPWFAEAVALAREHPDLDLGVHLTLNAEWEHYRWGPVVGPGSVPSLVASDGGFHRTTAETMTHAKPDEVESELRAQIELALESGIDVTHIDAHMGTAFVPPFLEIYAALAREFQVPAFAVRPSQEALAKVALPAVVEELMAVIERMECDGHPVLDAFDADSLGFEPGGGEAHNRERLRRLEPGVSYLICHPAQTGDELEAITEDAHCRDFERSFYGGEEGARALREEDIATVGMRAMRELLRG